MGMSENNRLIEACRGTFCHLVLALSYTGPDIVRLAGPCGYDLVCKHPAMIIRLNWKQLGQPPLGKNHGPKGKADVIILGL